MNGAGEAIDGLLGLLASATGRVAAPHRATTLPGSRPWAVG